MGSRNEMKKIKFNIDMYDWDVTVMLVNRKKDIPSMLKEVKKFKVEKDSSNFDVYYIKRGYEGGVHYYNRTDGKSLVCVYNCDNIRSMSKTLLHELRHVADRILETWSVNDHEAAAALTGLISLKVLPKVFSLNKQKQ